MSERLFPGLSRRRAAAVLAAGGALAMGCRAGAQPASAPVKGPPLWLDMDQQELDSAYDQAKYAPNLQQVVRRWASSTRQVQHHLGAPRRYAYGPSAVEGLDVYLAGGANAPINILIHGGEWRLGTAAGWGFAAELFVRAGAHFVVPDFASVQDVGGNLMVLADQVRRAVVWVHANAQRFSGDSNRLFLSGHSSGAHLAGVLLTTDWQRDFNLPADLLKGGLCSSGIYDLKPVCLSARRRYLACSESMEQALSPQRHLDVLGAPLLVSYGSLESPEFQRQARDFASALQAAGKPVRLLVGEGYNHFEIIETLANPYGLLGRAVLQQMKLT